MLQLSKFKIAFITTFAVASVFVSCQSVEEFVPAKTDSVSSARVQAVALSEGFEVGSTSPKTAYDVSPTGSSSGDNVTLQAKSWNLFDALIANSSSDKKAGSWSARVRNTGKITMLFNQTTGISTVTVKHAIYGTDGASTWGLWYSTNSGSSWVQSGSNITSTSTLQTQTFTINLTGTVRLEIRKATGGSNRINIDDIVINDNTGGGTGGTGKKFLFDATKYENAGNADWQIDADGTANVPTFTGGTTVETAAQRFPTPAAAGITSSTSETYWKGGMSAWAVELVKRGHQVESLPAGTAITYGNSSNPQDLSNYDVYLLIEPNRLFTASEKTAIINFVNNGGGLMLIADHTAATTGGTDANGNQPSDRDGDGYDSPRVINDLMTNNGINNNNLFGFTVDYIDIDEQPTTKVYTGSNTNAQKVLGGLAGTASKLAFYAGTSATLTPATNANVQGLFWRMGGTVGNNTQVMALLSTYGTGRIVFVGDSSPSDDGTGDTNDNLFNGWSGDSPSGFTSHPALHLNASLWLAKIQ
jgi:hypothetical protein